MRGVGRSFGPNWGAGLHLEAPKPQPLALRRAKRLQRWRELAERMRFLPVETAPERTTKPLRKKPGPRLPGYKSQG